MLHANVETLISEEYNKLHSLNCEDGEELFVPSERVASQALKVCGVCSTVLPISMYRYAGLFLYSISIKASMNSIIQVDLNPALNGRMNTSPQKEQCNAQLYLNVEAFLLRANVWQIYVLRIFSAAAVAHLSCIFLKLDVPCHRQPRYDLAETETKTTSRA